MPADATPSYVPSGDMAPAGEPSADVTSAEILAPRSRRRRKHARPAPASVAGAALLMLLHAAGTALGQREGESGGESGQGEGVPVSTTQGEVPGIPDESESAAGGADGVEGNAEPGGLPAGQRESSPIRLQSSDTALDRPIEPGEDIADAVADEIAPTRETRR